MRNWRSWCVRPPCIRLMSVAWLSLAAEVDHAMASLRNVRSEAGFTVRGSCMVKCHHPKSSGYCSTLDCKSSYVFRPMLDRSTCCFGSPAEVLTQPKVRQFMFQLMELIH